MNKIYKSIWNAVTQSYAAVSEAQKTSGKKSRSSSMVIGAALASMILSSSEITLAAEHIFPDESINWNQLIDGDSYSINEDLSLTGLSIKGNQNSFNLKDGVTLTLNKDQSGGGHLQINGGAIKGNHVTINIFGVGTRISNDKPEATTETSSYFYGNNILQLDENSVINAVDYDSVTDYHGGTLRINGDNSEFNGTLNAHSLVLNNVNAYGDDAKVTAYSLLFEGLKDNTTPNLYNTDVTFNYSYGGDVSGEIDNVAGQVTVGSSQAHANVQYKTGLKMNNVRSTTIQIGGELTVDAQGNSDFYNNLLGSIVRIHGQKAYLDSIGVLRINNLQLLTSNAETNNPFHISSSDGYGYLYIDADGEKFSIADQYVFGIRKLSEDQQRFAGIFQLNNGTIHLDKEQVDRIFDPTEVTGWNYGLYSAGFLAGSDTTVLLDNTGSNSYITLGRFGWGAEGAVIDFSSVNFNLSSAYPYRVRQLYTADNRNYIGLEMNRIIDADSNLFELQNLQNQVLLSFDNSTVKDLSNSDFTITDSSFISISNEGNDEIAKYYWKISPDVADQKLSVNYELNQLELLGGIEGNNYESLQYTVLVEEGQPTGQSIDVDVTGSGILTLKASENDPENLGIVSINGSLNFNGALAVYDGVQVNVNRDSKVTTSSTSLQLLGQNSSFSTNSQILVGGLATDQDEHTIYLSSPNSQLKVTDDNVVSLTGAIDAQKGNYLGKNTRLKGSGTLVLDSTNLTVENASNTFNNAFTGSVDLVSGDNLPSSLTISTGKLQNASFIGAIGDTITFRDEASAVLSSIPNVQGADFSLFAGQINLGANSYEIADSNAIHDDAIFSANKSEITFGTKYAGSFDNQINGSSSKWVLQKGADVTVNGETSSKEAVENIHLNDGAELHLMNGTDSGALQQFADGVTFTGNGTLDLNQYQLTDTKINLADTGNARFNGILSLTGNSVFTLTKNQHQYGSFVQTGSKLIVQKSTTLSSLEFGSSQEGSEAHLTLEGDSVLNVTGNLTAGNGVHVQVDDSRWLSDTLKINLLAQDEGWNHTLITASSADITDNSFHIVADDTTVTPEGHISLTLQEGVTGTYQQMLNSGNQANNRWQLGIGFKLTELALDETADLTLTAESEDNATDLNNVELSGAGRINIKNDVTINASASSDYEGIFNVAESSSLTLSGTDVGNAVQLTESNSALLINSNQALHLDAVHGGQLTINDQAELTLTGLSTSDNLNELGTDAKLEMKGTGTLRLDGNTNVSSHFAASLLNGFNGSLLLNNGSVLALSESTDTLVSLTALTKDQNDRTQSGTVELLKGQYQFSTNSDFDGTFDITDASLTLTADAEELKTKLSSAENSPSAKVIVQKGDADELLINGNLGKDYNGSWEISDNAVLHLNQTQVGGIFTVDKDGTLKVSGSSEAGAPTVFGNTVSGGQFVVNSGFVLLGSSDRQLDNLTTTINNDAVLATTNFDSLSSESYNIGGRLIIADSTAENNALTLGNFKATGNGVLQLLVGTENNVGTLDFASDNTLDLTGFNGEILLSRGTYTFDVNDTGFTGSTASFGVAHQGVFKISGQLNVSGPDSGTFIFDSIQRETGEYVGGGTIDLTDYTGDYDQPAMHVNTLQVNAAGYIKINPQNWLTGADEQAPENDVNILDADDTYSDRFILVADQILGTGEGGAVNSEIHLVDENGNPIDKGESLKVFQYSDSDNQKYDVAVGHWGYDANIVTSSDKDNPTKGVAIGYQLTQIDLKQIKEHPEAGLIISANRDNPTDETNTLSALVTGKGTIYIDSTLDNNESTAIRMSHINNTFSGNVVVKENSHLIASAAYTLGAGDNNTETDPNKLVSVYLRHNAALTLGDNIESNLGTQRLAKIEAAAGSVVTLANNSLYLVGNDNYQSHFAEGSTVSLMEGAQQSNLAVVSGTAIFDDASGTLNNFLASDGSLLTIQNGAVVQFDGQDGTPFNLNHLRGSGTALINTDTQLGDNRNFSGLYQVTDHTMKMSDNSTHWNSESSVSLSNASFDLSLLSGTVSLNTLNSVGNSAIKMGTVELFYSTSNSTVLNTQNADLKNTQLVIDVDQDVALANTNQLLNVDASDGVNTKILGSSGSFETADLSLKVNGKDSLNDLSSRLSIAGSEIGTLTYDLKLVTTEDSIAVNSHAKTLAIDEGKTLSLVGSYDPSSAENQNTSTLDIELINGTGTVKVNGAVKLSQENNFGNLNVLPGADVYLGETQILNNGQSILNGLVHSDSGKTALQINEGAEFVTTLYQTELKDSIRLNGGTFSIQGSGSIEEDTPLLVSDLIVSAPDSTLNISNVKGTITNDMFKTAAGLDKRLLTLNIKDGSLIIIEKDESAISSSMSTLGTVTIGDNNQDSPESALHVRTSGSSFNAATESDITINENGVLHYDLTVEDVETDEAVIGRISSLSGNGKLEVHLLHDGETSPGHLHEVIFAGGERQNIDFSGTFSLINGVFTFGKDSGEAYRFNHELSQQVWLEAGADSVFRVMGETSVLGLTLDPSSTLDLSQIGTPDNNYGSSSNLLHIDDKGVFTAQSGSTIQINKSDFTAETSLHGAINTIDEENGYDFASVVNSNAEAYESKFFQIVDGSVDIGNRVSLKDENGALLGEEITIALYEKDSGTHLADLVGGWATIADKTGLYVGQRVEGIRLDQTSIDLFSQPNETVTINQWIESKNDTVNLNITQGTIKLTSDATDFAGDVIVHENANLIVAQDGALGGHVEGTSAAGLQLQKKATAEINEAVNQTISSLSVSEGATLHLNKDSVLTLSTDGSQTQTRMDGILIGEEDSVFNTTGQVFVTDTTELSQMQGTLHMQSETDAWVFSIEEDKNFTKGAIVNGQVIKDGAGTLQLGLEQFNDGSTSVTVNKGGLTFANWNSAGSALNLKNFTLTETAEAFRLSGNMRLNNGRGTFTNQGTVFVGEHATGETDFATRFIRGNWTGNGTIVFDAYLGDNTPTGVEEDLVEETKENTSKTNERVDATYGEKSDLLVIRGTATGDAVLKVNNINSVDSGKLERLALMEVGDDADFNPTLYGGSIEAGGYSYRLVRHDSEGGNLDFGADYILTSYADEESTWTDRNVSVNTGAFIGFAAASQMFDLSIHDRQGTRPYINPLTGEKTQTSMWMRETISHERSHDSTGQLSMRSNTSVTQIGGDIVQLNTSGNGYVFAGLMAGWGTQDLKSRSSRVEAYANADIEGWNIGFYGGWHQNDPAVDRTGAYVNGWLQYSHLKGEFDNHMDSATARASGLSASLEAGYNIRALSWYNDEHFGASEVFIEPRAQVTWWGTEFDDMQMSGDVEFLGKDNITTRLGVRASAVVNGNSTIVPYAEANWVHNTHAYGAKYGELTDHQAGANDTAEMKLGVEFEIHKNFTGYGQFSVNLGNESYSERAGSLGIKYRF